METEKPPSTGSVRAIWLVDIVTAQALHIGVMQTVFSAMVAELSRIHSAAHEGHAAPAEECEEGECGPLGTSAEKSFKGFKMLEQTADKVREAYAVLNGAIGVGVTMQ